MYTSTISDQTDHTETAPALHYDGASPLTGVPLYNDILLEFDNAMTDVLQQRLSDKQSIHFMPIAVSDEAEYINGVSTYILRITSCLINRQKAIVNVMGIKPFFDIIIPEEIPLSMFKTKLVKIVSNILGSTSKFGIKTINQNKVLKAVRKVGISTTFDDLNPTYYYRKVACEERLPLSSWAMLSNYFHEYIQGETYSSLRLGKFPTAQSDESNVFMIGISVHWKDDPNPLNRSVLLMLKLPQTFAGSQLYAGIKESEKARAEKSSLAYYLKECELDNKLDMPFHHMFKYYGRALKETNTTTAKQIYEVAEYYIIDAISCQRLMSIKHKNQAEMKGLYPKVLEELLIRRNSLKRHLAPLKDKKEELEKEISLAEARGKDVTDALKSEYSSVSFIVACLNAKQLALKVYMNTFYGEARNSGFPFFLSKGFGVKYRNTDSLYLVCPEEYFWKCDEKYISEKISKEKYWKEMVGISMEAMSKLQDEVNDFLREDNGSLYLKMAYEEVLFPVVFTGKKKYYGIPHISKPNFNNKLFIQEVEIVKRGQSKYFREVGKKVMNESMRLDNDNIRTLHQIVKDVLKETINDISQIDLNGGLIPELYLYKIPEPGERFEYIVVENDLSQRVEDKMEYPEPSSEIVLGALKKLKDGNKVGDSKADDGGVDGDDLDEDENNEDEMDEDEVLKIRDVLAQKSAEKWIKGYIKSLRDI
ncbi:hypothetical protein C1646_763850 [Rhizophagus diaphanus]|nr:hypothetical protein C1646_763850 [Rhizophagus diaphanus] [Rhizophagus sp. MUCL 43196]